MTGRTAIVQLVQLASALLIARVLVPDLYAAFAFGSTVVGFGRVVGDCGAASAVIQSPGSEPTRPQALRAIAFVQLCIAVAAVALLVGVAPTIRSLMGGPAETVPIVVFMSVSLLVEAFGAVPKMRLQRELRFERLGIILLAQSLSLYAVQIIGLLLGFGVWALVAAQVVGSIVLTTLLVANGGGIVRPSSAGALELVRRGIAYQGTLITTAATALASTAIIGAVLGADRLGLYSWATILATPLILAVQNIHDVGFPALARLHEHHVARYHEAVALVARLLSVVVAGAVGVLCAFAPAIIGLVFDDRWLRAAGAGRAALVGAVPLAFTWLLAASIESSGRPKLRLAGVLIGSAVGLALVAPAASRFGASGAGLAMYLVVPAVDMVFLALVSRVPMTRAFVDALLVGSISLALSLPFAARVDSLVELLLFGGLCSLASLAAMVVVDRRAIARAASFLRPREPEAAVAA